MAALQTTCLRNTTARPAVARRARLDVRAAAWTKVATKDSLAEAGGKTVVELNNKKVLVVKDGDNVYAVSNKCSHLGLPLVGKVVEKEGSPCIVCPAHNTAFDLASGQVKGEWCPKFPQLPLVGKIGDSKPLPTFQSRVDEAGNVEVYI